MTAQSAELTLQNQQCVEARVCSHTGTCRLTQWQGRNLDDALERRLKERRPWLRCARGPGLMQLRRPQL